TISHQLALASSPSAAQPPAKEVDLLLIDGCANNVGIGKVLNPHASDDELRNDTRAYCGAGMTNLLREAVSRFPNADVIVTGYFPYMSRATDVAAVAAVLVWIPAAPPDPVSGNLSRATDYRNRIATRSDIFFQESNQALQAAVDTINSEALPGRTRFGQI